MAMAPQQPPQDRSKSLHNFSLPCLKWGNQRVLRCVKVTGGGDQNHRRRSSSPIRNGFQSNYDAQKNHKSISIQQNPVSPHDVRFNNNAGGGGGAKRLKVSPLIEDEKGGIGGGDIDDSARPWNLRTRRAACKAPPLGIEEKRNVDSPGKILDIDSPRRIETCSVNKQHCVVEPVKERIKFSVPLSKREIEQDFMEMAKIRPPRRPKKRPRIVQKYLDSIFPGLWLTEVTADAYKVPEVPES